MILPAQGSPLQTSLSIFAQGFFLQASLILALGAQNIFVLNSGLRKDRHLVVALVSSLCDAILIFIGVLGVTSFFIQIPLLKICLGAIGVGFLFYYGLLKLKEAKSGTQTIHSIQQRLGLKQTILTTMGFSLLNPHVYLDTIVLLGSYSTKFSIGTHRFLFGAGASLFSALWFFGLVLLASWASQLLKQPKAMRFVSFVSAIVLISLSLKLGTEVIEWIVK